MKHVIPYIPIRKQHCNYLYKKILLWYSSFQTSEYKVFQKQLNNKDVFALSLLLVALYETCLYCQTYILKILF